MTMCRYPGAPRKSSCFTRRRCQAPTGRHANPTLAGGSDDEAADTIRCGQERLLCGGPSKGRAITENSNSNDDNGAGQIAMTDDLFGLPGDGVHCDSGTRQPTIGGLRTQEQAAAAAISPTIPAVVGDRLPHVDRQRQPVAAVALPVTVNSPICQMMSSTDRAATSPDLRPSRTSTVRIAKSRHPTVVRRSQPSNIRATSEGATAHVNPWSRQPGATGTASTNCASVSPCKYRNRSNARNPVVTLLSDPGLRRAASLSTNTFTASADAPTRSSPCQRHPARNRSATLR